MPDLEPITREEKLLDGEDLTPITRKEQFIKRIYDKTQEIPEPITREEMFLKKAGEGGGGDVTIEQLNVTENGTYSEEGKAFSPVIVEVPQPTMTKLTATENGTYTAPSGTAYNEVDVDVPLPSNAYLLKEVEDLPASIATFSDGSDMPLKSLIASIEAVQEGSGDPSPTNIRPISGWTEEVITRCGKNLLDKASGKIAEVNPRFIAFGVDNFSDTKPNGSIKLESGTYTFSTSGSLSTNLEAIAVFNSSNERIGIAYNNTKLTFTVTTTDFFKISLSVMAGDFTNWDNYNLQLEQGTTATTYEPYAGTTYTIPFTDSQGNPVEVYGGSVDVVNGSLTEDVNFYDDLKNVVFELSANGQYYWSRSSTIPYALSQSDGMCSHFKFSSSGDVFCGTSDATGHYILFYKSKIDSALGISSVAEFNTWLANQSTNGTPVQLWYKLATPNAPIQQQPTSIKSLDGVNNVFASTGDVEELKYFSKEVE